MPWKLQIERHREHQFALENEINIIRIDEKAKSKVESSTQTCNFHNDFNNIPQLFPIKPYHERLRIYSLIH